MSIQPGETYLPRASISVVPRSVTRPIFTKRPSLMATSPRIHGLPAPSSTRPLRMTTSYAKGAPAGWAAAARVTAHPSVMPTHAPTTRVGRTAHHERLRSSLTTTPGNELDQTKVCDGESRGDGIILWWRRLVAVGKRGAHGDLQALMLSSQNCGGVH